MILRRRYPHFTRYVQALTAMLVVTLIVFGTGSAHASASTAIVAVNVTSAQSTVTQGGDAMLAVSVTNRTTAGLATNVTLRVLNSKGSSVYAKLWSNATLVTGGTAHYQVDVSTSSFAVGQYSVRLSVATQTTSLYDSANTSTFTVVTSAPAVTPTPALASPTSSIFWGAYISGAPWDMTKLTAFESSVGKGVSIVHWGQPWIHNGQYQPFYASDLQRIRDHGSIPMLDWASWDYALGPNQANFQLANITGGQYDAYITQWAISARNWGHPFFLRFDWEMNGNWQFPWSEQLNGNQAGDFVRAWQHVHDIFTSVGATNVTWVWCPNADYPGATSLASVYPGDAYVDWVGIDAYNWGLDKDGWRSFGQMFGTTYNALVTLAPAKPIMIGETSSSEDGGSKAAWVTDALATQLPHVFPQIKAVVWMNWNCGDPSLDWPFNSSATALTAAKIAFASDYYTSNTFAALNTAPIAPR